MGAAPASLEPQAGAGARAGASANGSQGAGASAGASAGAGADADAAAQLQPVDGPALEEQCRRLLHTCRAAECLQLLQHAAAQGGGQPVLALPSARALLPLVARAATPPLACALLRLLPPSASLYHALAVEYGRRGSVAGVRCVLSEVARDERLLAQGKRNLLSRHTLLAALRAYGAAKRPELADTVFEAARQRGAWSPSHTAAGNALLNAHADSADAALERFSMLQGCGWQPDLVSFNTLLKACMRARDANAAARVAGAMAAAGIAGDEYTHNTLIKVYSYSGRLDCLESLYLSLVADADADHAAAAITPSVWGSLITAYGAAGQPEAAFGVWRELRGRGRQPTTDVCNALMNAAVKASQNERALCVFEGMPSWGASRDATSFNLAVKACGAPPGRALRRPELDAAFELLRQMEAAGIEPDCVTVTTLADLCAQAGEGGRAWALWQRVCAGGLRADTALATAVIKALGAGGMADEALSVFGRCVWGPARLRPNRRTYLTLVQLCREARRLDEAFRVYQGMRRAGFAPDNGEFRALMAACAEQALSDSAQPCCAAHAGAGGEAALPCALFVSEDGVLDLHGLSVVEARAAVLCVVGALVAQRRQHVAAGGGGGGGGGAGREPWELSRDLVVITGAGRNSGREGPKLRAEVVRLLQDALRLPVCVPPAAAPPPRRAARGQQPAAPPGSRPVPVEEGRRRPRAQGAQLLRGAQTAARRVNGPPAATPATPTLPGSGPSPASPPAASTPAAARSAATGAAAPKRRQQRGGAAGARVNHGRLVVAKEALNEWLASRGTDALLTSAHASARAMAAAEE